MKIALVGAHGKVGRLLVPILVDHDATVTGIVRAEEQLPLVRRLGGEPLLLDVEHASTEEIAAALDGFDAVVWSAGAGGGNPERTYAVDRDAASRTMDAAVAAGVPRYVMVSWIGSVHGHRVRALGVQNFGQSGSIQELYGHYGLDAEAILAAAEGIIGRPVRYRNRVA